MISVVVAIIVTDPALGLPQICAPHQVPFYSSQHLGTDNGC